MHLAGLLENIYEGGIKPQHREKEIFAICSDSRQVARGGLFVALKGEKFDGRNFIPDVVEKGAVAIALAGNPRVWSLKYPHVCFLEVKNPEEFLFYCLRRFYGDAVDNMKVIGVTGTNGKTTVTYLVESMMKAAGMKCGVLGTVNYRFLNNIIPAGQTTPGIADIYHFLADLAWQQAPYCVMEVSSHALAQARVRGINFRAGVFTNLTSDHMDYHKTQENYFSSKALLFRGLSPESVAVINADDLFGMKLIPLTQANILSYGIMRRADVMAKDIHLDESGTQLTLTSPLGQKTVRTKLIGMHNVYNILCAVAVSAAEGFSLEAVEKGITETDTIPGRLERVEAGQDFSVFIDFAHTQDALRNVLSALRQVSKGKIILVFGCGGDRDKTKRMPMGKVAGDLADFSIVTSDNPRSEDPVAIIDEIVKGFHKDNYKIIVQREEAIRESIAMAQPGDVVLIAGKGHETYQVLADKKIDFNERMIIQKILAR